VADQAAPDTITGQTGIESHGQAALHRDSSGQLVYHGRTTSWVTTAIVFIGFTVGGALFGAATRIFDDWY